MDDRRELAKFLREISDWNWIDFLKAEADKKYTTNQSVVLAVIRSAAMENLKALVTAVNRLDGKMEVPVQVVTPKIYFLFPNATEAAKVIEGTVLEKLGPEPTALTIISEEEMEEDMPSQSFRETMRKMGRLDRGFPGRVIECQEKWENFFRDRGQIPTNKKKEIEHVKVSSVVAARLLRMAQNRDMKALDEVFNQLDGKLVETVRIVGEDMYIMQWATVAPAGAERNEDGVYQIEAPRRTTQMWGERLDATKKGINSIIEEE